MLHFPSKNTAAHTADPTDVTRLHQLLGHHIWAFSNCRVDAPPVRVQEVDWLFYNSLNGTFILSEWKRFPAQVSQVRDVGEPWGLANGASVANPLEQVARQLDAVRRALRLSVVGKHLPAVDQHAINVYQSVYCPQVTEATRQERLRYGTVHATLDELARTVERRAVTAPLVVVSGIAQVALADALAELFRCSVGTAVRRKLDPPVAVGPPALPEPAAAAPRTRVAAIHRELAALHLELASLVDAPAPAPVPAPVPAPAQVPVPVPVPGTPAKKALAAQAKKSPPVAGHLQHHVMKHVPSARAGSDHVRVAFLAALQDGQLRKSGVHVGEFGALVGQRLEGSVKLASLTPGGLKKWCLTQAEAAGIPAEPDATHPSVVRLVRTAGQR
ncbi:hypothetical protein RCH21_002579 [Arthrobacter sp. PL16]|uniref:hypothetical protein n=1 Tax=Arthrobacter sp. PL16 TaxID=3071720 RepID=UPI002E03BD9A|nr:hypothetical protein [Arthrobacter sp. PL16]